MVGEINNLLFLHDIYRYKFTTIVDDFNNNKELTYDRVDRLAQRRKINQWKGKCGNCIETNEFFTIDFVLAIFPLEISNVLTNQCIEEYKQ